MWIIIGKPQATFNVTAHVGVIILECGGPSSMWVVCAFVYLVFFTIITYFFAMKAQKIPTQSSEARFICFGILFSMLVFLAFVPAYSSTQGKFSMATKLCAVISFTYGIFGCIFAPKCYTIFAKPKI